MSDVDWSRFQQCPVCFAELGKPCVKLHGVVAGVCEIVEDAEAPHSGRKLRTGAVDG